MKNFDEAVSILFDKSDSSFDEGTQILRCRLSGLEIEPLHGIKCWIVRGPKGTIERCSKDEFLRKNGFVVAPNDEFIAL